MTPFQGSRVSTGIPEEVGIPQAETFALSYVAVVQETSRAQGTAGNQSQLASSGPQEAGGEFCSSAAVHSSGRSSQV